MSPSESCVASRFARRQQRTSEPQPTTHPRPPPLPPPSLCSLLPPTPPQHKVKATRACPQQTSICNTLLCNGLARRCKRPPRKTQRSGLVSVPSSSGPVSSTRSSKRHSESCRTRSSASAFPSSSSSPLWLSTLSSLEESGRSRAFCGSGGGPGRGRRCAARDSHLWTVELPTTQASKVRSVSFDVAMRFDKASSRRCSLCDGIWRGMGWGREDETVSCEDDIGPRSTCARP